MPAGFGSSLERSDLERLLRSSRAKLIFQELQSMDIVSRISLQPL